MLLIINIPSLKVFLMLSSITAILLFTLCIYIFFTIKINCIETEAQIVNVSPSIFQNKNKTTNKIEYKVTYAYSLDSNYAYEGKTIYSLPYGTTTNPPIKNSVAIIYYKKDNPSIIFTRKDFKMAFVGLIISIITLFPSLIYLIYLVIQH